MDHELRKVWHKSIRKRRHKLRDRANTPGFDEQGNCIIKKPNGNEKQAEAPQPPPDQDQSV